MSRFLHTSNYLLPVDLPIHFIHLIYLSQHADHPDRWMQYNPSNATYQHGDDQEFDNGTIFTSQKKARRKADSTLRSSQAVPHPSTNWALRCLTSEVERDPVHSTRYGRRRKTCFSFIQE